MTMLLFYTLLSIFASAALAGSLTDIKHVVLFMQENRAFDHYFGTMAGMSVLNQPNRCADAEFDRRPRIRGSQRASQSGWNDSIFPTRYSQYE
jgi:phospholipase C